MHVCPCEERPPLLRVVVIGLVEGVEGLSSTRTLSPGCGGSCSPRVTTEPSAVSAEEKEEAAKMSSAELAGLRAGSSSSSAAARPACRRSSKRRPLLSSLLSQLLGGGVSDSIVGRVATASPSASMLLIPPVVSSHASPRISGVPKSAVAATAAAIAALSASGVVSKVLASVARSGSRSAPLLLPVVLNFCAGWVFRGGDITVGERSWRASDADVEAARVRNDPLAPSSVATEPLATVSFFLDDSFLVLRADGGAYNSSVDKVFAKSGVLSPWS